VTWTYRGHLVHVKKVTIMVPSAGKNIWTWAAAPQSVDLPRFSLQLRCTFAVGEDERIITPNGLQIGLDLLLSRARPRCVVALCNADAAVPQEYGNSIERDTSK